MLIIRRIASTILAFALVAAPAMSVRDHCLDHRAMAGMEMPSNAPASTDHQHSTPPCDHSAAGLCSSMISCVSAPATIAERATLPDAMHATLAGLVLTQLPFSLATPPDTPPPRV